MPVLPSSRAARTCVSATATGSSTAAHVNGGVKVHVAVAVYEHVKVNVHDDGDLTQSRMPAFGKAGADNPALSAGDVADLVAFIWSVQAPSR